ncbi:hypothetical protein LC612_40910 [Nostoc sp. CHAB 5834]|nr:hypothetical protein [Nostoc sp. CHAB 5834]
MKTHPFFRSLVAIPLGLTLLTSCAPAVSKIWPSSKEEHKRHQEWEKDRAEWAWKRWKAQREWEKDPLGAGKSLYNQ